MSCKSDDRVDQHGCSDMEVQEQHSIEDYEGIFSRWVGGEISPLWPGRDDELDQLKEAQAYDSDPKQDYNSIPQFIICSNGFNLDETENIWPNLNDNDHLQIQQGSALDRHYDVWEVQRSNPPSSCSTSTALTNWPTLCSFSSSESMSTLSLASSGGDDTDLSSDFAFDMDLMEKIVDGQSEDIMELKKQMAEEEDESARNNLENLRRERLARLEFVIEKFKRVVDYLRQ